MFSPTATLLHTQASLHRKIEVEQKDLDYSSNGLMFQMDMV